MTRTNILLLIALFVSSLYLVKVSYESRRLFTALDRAKTQSLQLETDHERLQIEQRAQATPLRVEKMAREKLAMRTATPAVTVYVELPPSLAAASAAAPASPLPAAASGAGG